MPRRDPLQLLKQTPNLSLAPHNVENGSLLEDHDTDEKVKITIQLPLKTSNELKKLAIDNRIGRDHLLYCLIRQLQTNPDLMKTTLDIAKKTYRKM
jgi:hypothetical protein